MTTATYTLGRPRLAGSRGGDCAIYDLDQDERPVGGPHRFAAPQHCRVENGMLRLTVGGAGDTPSLGVEVWRGRVTVNDTFPTTFPETYPGSISAPAWFDMGSIVIDSPSVAAELTGVRIVKLTLEVVVLQLRAPLMADAFVVLRRGEPMVHIQHGETRPPFVDIDRRVSFTDSPTPVGFASLGRVEEPAAATDGLRRFVAGIVPVTTDIGDFSVTATSATTANLGAGVGTYSPSATPVDLHRQLRNASRVRRLD